MWKARLGCQGVGSRLCSENKPHDVHVRHCRGPSRFCPLEKGKIVASAPVQLGAAAKPAPAPAKPPSSVPAELKLGVKQSSKVPVTQVAVEVDAGDVTQHVDMFPPTADQLSAVISMTFTVVPKGGQGDCTYIAVGMAIAEASGANLGAP